MSKSTKSRKPSRVSAPEMPIEAEEGDDKIIGRAFRWSLGVIVTIGVVAAGTIYWINREPPTPKIEAQPVVVAQGREQSSVEVPGVVFTDITSQSGITFVHENGAYGAKLLPETMGGGCAFFDYNNDGHQDLLLVNSSQWPWNASQDKPPATLVLYSNDGTGKFKDVTEEAGLKMSLYGMGAAVGDYDNDGWVDLFISAVGRNRLLRNTEGKFTDTTDTAGVGGSDTEWSTSTGWIDYDNDGDLDLFVCNYVRWSKEIDEKQNFRLVGVGRAYGPPIAFEGSFPYLYRNEGDGKFTEVSAEAGVQVKNPATGVPMAKSLGLAPVDLDQDGWIDLIVANDTVQNFAFHNQRNGTFREIGAESGVAFDPSGNARGAMGIDSAFFRNDDSLGIGIGNFANEMVSLYVSQGDPLQFADEANANGLGPPTRLALKFGLFFFDYDLDCRLDVLTANGHLEEEINKVQVSQHYEQPPQLFWNSGREEKTEFLPVAAEKCGSDFGKPMVGRGASYADIDSDGDLDVLITGSGQAPRLLRNDQQLGNHWLRLKLVGKQANRDAIGAMIEVKLGDEILRRQVMPTRSYLSQTELPVTIGIGKATQVDKVVIRWPGGATQEVADVGVDRLTVVEQAP